MQNDIKAIRMINAMINAIVLQKFSRGLGYALGKRKSGKCRVKHEGAKHVLHVKAYSPKS